jgi:hypothetical protein
MSLLALAHTIFRHAGWKLSIIHFSNLNFNFQFLAFAGQKKNLA